MVTKPDSATVGSGKYLQTDANGNPVWDDPAGASAIVDAVESWLDENVSGGETIAVDDTLSIPHAGADAKAAGDAIAAKADATDTVLQTTLSRGRKDGTTAGVGSLAFGVSVEASGRYSAATGNTSKATGNYSHAEGTMTHASESAAHAEGGYTTASGVYAHAEGYFTTADQMAMTAVGVYNKEGTTYPSWQGGTHYYVGDTVLATINQFLAVCIEENEDTSFDASKWEIHACQSKELFVVGNGNSGNRSNAFEVHSSGDIVAAGDIFANGDKKLATATDTVLQTTLSRGRLTESDVGEGSFAFGDDVIASGDYAHAEGNWVMTYDSQTQETNLFRSTASGDASHSEGCAEASGDYAHAEGYGTTASGQGAHSEGNRTTASGNYTHAEGNQTSATITYAHAEGVYSAAAGNAAHAEGQSTQASGNSAHAEGYNTNASGNYAHAEGNSTMASGQSTHTEGASTRATGNFSHAEGSSSVASGMTSHAEGSSTTASGDWSHTSGRGTRADGPCLFACGSYNDTTLYPAWVSGTAYAVGDRVHRGSYGYECITANSDTSFYSNKWR